VDRDDKIVVWGCALAGAALLVLLILERIA
jgi:hypothetical protein